MSRAELEPGDPFRTDLIETASESDAIEEAYNSWPSFETEQGVEARLVYRDRWEQLSLSLNSTQRYLDQMREILKSSHPSEHQVEELLRHIRASTGDAVFHLARFGRFEHRPCFNDRLTDPCSRRAVQRVMYKDYDGDLVSLIFCKEHADARASYLEEQGIPFEVALIPADEILPVS